MAAGRRRAPGIDPCRRRGGRASRARPCERIRSLSQAIAKFPEALYPQLVHKECIISYRTIEIASSGCTVRRRSNSTAGARVRVIRRRRPSYRELAPGVQTGAVKRGCS